MLPPGCRVATLDHRAAAELGLDTDTVVATRWIQTQTEEEERTEDLLVYLSSLIDAHAGALGMLAGVEAGRGVGRLGLVTGTSTCHMLLSRLGHVLHVTRDTRDTCYT